MQRSLISNLGGQEVLEDSKLVDLELHDKGLFLVQAETSEVADRGCLVEHVEVAESKLLRNRLLNFENSGVLALLRAIILAKLDRT